MRDSADRPAIGKASPVRIPAFPAWPQYAADEIDAALRVLRSGRVNYWTGSEGKNFEREFAEAVGARYAVALMNGTVALEAALHVLGVGPGDEVIVPSRTFIASASCVVQRGAIPVVADVDPVSQNLTADSVRARLTPRTRAIIAVHLAGWPCDMDPIRELADQHGIKVVEDCAQAPGARYKGRSVGTLGHVAAFSFCQDKIITTGGEGGMLVTDDRELWERAWSYKDHGKNRQAALDALSGTGFSWVHESFGTNLRMTEIQAAIGRVQLGKLPSWLEARRRHAALLNGCFSKIPTLRTAVPDSDFEHAYYKYYAFVRTDRLRQGWGRDRILQAVVSHGVPCFTGSCAEIYLEKAFPPHWRPEDRLPVARELGETSLMFLVHPTLRAEHVEETCRVVGNVMALAGV